MNVKLAFADATRAIVNANEAFQSLARAVRAGQARPMLGDIVRPRPGRDPLRSGASAYRDAVVVRVSPFALVSREGDMLWSHTVSREDFQVTDRASFELWDRCRKRVTHGLTNRRIKRERSKMRRRLAR